MSKSSPAVKRTATWPRNEARTMPGAGSIGNRSAQFPGGTTGQQGERLTRRERKFDMTSSSNTKADVEILTDLNANYLRSDQSGDVKWYAEHLADDFTATLPDLMMAQPRGFTKLMAP